ncbi:MAG: winged helix-turn-helix transcriptional regulator [Candidatus Thermoplasmatota archaeon]
MDPLVRLVKPKGTLQIITHLEKKGESRLTEIKRETGLTINTTYAALRHLFDLKLVTQELSAGFPSAKYYKLTEKGMEIAGQLTAISKSLSEK